MLSIISEAFMLGLSTGVYCFSQCGIVIVPFIFSGEGGLKSRSQNIFLFLSGRFIAYSAVGILFGFIGQSFSAVIGEHNNAYKIITAVSFFALSFIILLNAIRSNNRHGSCGNKKNKSGGYPFLLGIFTGMNICPPFIAAAARAIDSGSVFRGGSFFVVFFVATTILIMPLIFTGLIKYTDTLRKVARITSAIAGVYLIIEGVGYLITG